MNTQKILPLAALVTMLVGAGAMVATAQNLDTPAADTAVVQADFGGGRGGHGGGRGGDMLREILTLVDADNDGAISQAEIDTFRAAQVGAADTNGDGQISLAEFGPAWTTFMQSRIVDDFQRLDDNGDGQIAADELDARLGGVVERMDRNGDGLLSPDDRGRRGGDRG